MKVLSSWEKDWVGVMKENDSMSENEIELVTSACDDTSSEPVTFWPSVSCQV